MKEYKLKLWYPSLPKDWEIGMEVGQGERGLLGDYSPCNGKYTDKYLNREEVENNLWYWGLIKDEVLYTTSNGHKFYKGDIVWGISCSQLELGKEIARKEIFDDNWEYGYFASESEALAKINDIKNTLATHIPYDYHSHFDLIKKLEKLVYLRKNL